MVFSNMQKKAVSITIHGRVQGVGFRYFVYNLAKEMGVEGSVRNRPDGTVYVEAQAPADLLETFTYHCKQGPSHSHVRRADVIPIPTQQDVSEFYIG